MIADELRLFVRAFWYGAQLMMGYGLLRVRRGLRATSLSSCARQDIVFAAVGGVYLFARFFDASNGNISLWSLAACALGARIWDLSAGRFLERLLLAVPGRCRGCLRRIAGARILRAGRAAQERKKRKKG